MHLSFLPNAHVTSLRYPTENCTSASHCYQSYLRYRCCISNISLIFIFLINAAYCSRLLNKLTCHLTYTLSLSWTFRGQSMRSWRHDIVNENWVIGYQKQTILYLITLYVIRLTPPWMEHFIPLDLDSMLSSSVAWGTRLSTSSISQITCSTTIGLLSR